MYDVREQLDTPRRGLQLVLSRRLALVITAGGCGRGIERRMTDLALDIATEAPYAAGGREQQRVRVTARNVRDAHVGHGLDELRRRDLVEGAVAQLALVVLAERVHAAVVEQHERKELAGAHVRHERALGTDRHDGRHLDFLGVTGAALAVLVAAKGPQDAGHGDDARVRGAQRHLQHKVVGERGHQCRLLDRATLGAALLLLGHARRRQLSVVRVRVAELAGAAVGTKGVELAVGRDDGALGIEGSGARDRTGDLGDLDRHRDDLVALAAELPLGAVARAEERAVGGDEEPMATLGLVDAAAQLQRAERRVGLWHRAVGHADAGALAAEHQAAGFGRKEDGTLGARDRHDRIGRVLVAEALEGRCVSELVRLNVVVPRRRAKDPHVAVVARAPAESHSLLERQASDRLVQMHVEIVAVDLHETKQALGCTEHGRRV